MTENTTGKRRSLASTFGAKTAPDRSEGLSGLLPTRGNTPAPSPRPATAPAPPRVLHDVAADDRPKPPRAEPPTPRVVQPSPIATKPRPEPVIHVDETVGTVDGGTIVNVTAYLDRATQKALHECAAEEQCDHSHVVIAAFDAVGDRLGDLFRPLVGRSAAGMPIRREPLQVKSGVETWFRFTIEQRDWLDEQQKKVGAKSRSHLLAGLLAHYLETRSR